MKSFFKDLSKSLRITIAFCIFFALSYVLVLWLFAQFAAPGDGGNAQTVTYNGRVVGVANVGQKFTKDVYFWGRPSMAGDGYDGTSSSGSNKGPANEEYLAEVAERVDSFLVHHPYLKREDVPAEMVTASASGLDPHITLACADVQVKRVSSARGVSEAAVRDVLNRVMEKPLLGFIGTSKVNVLKLNVALDETFGNGQVED